MAMEKKDLSVKDKASLTKYGFDLSGATTINTSNRLIMAVSAFEKRGKTGFGLTMPKPIVVFNFDRKIELVTLATLGVDPQDIIIKEIRIDGDATQDVHRRQWDELHAAFMWALRDADSVKSILIDTESEMWELARLAYFGKLTQVMPHKYTEVNAVYKNMLDMADKYDKNVMFLRKWKKEYKDDVWRGKYESAGFGKLKDVVQVNAEMYIDDAGAFTVEVLTNGLKASMNGITLSGEMCNFTMLAAMMTDTDPEDWQ